jgi:hypothetical protein
MFKSSGFVSFILCYSCHELLLSQINLSFISKIWLKIILFYFQPWIIKCYWVNFKTLFLYRYELTIVILLRELMRKKDFVLIKLMVTVNWWPIQKIKISFINTDSFFLSQELLFFKNDSCKNRKKHAWKPLPLYVIRLNTFLNVFYSKNSNTANFLCFFRQ